MWQATPQLYFEMMIVETFHGMLGTVLILAISPPSYGIPSRLLGHNGDDCPSSSSSSLLFCLARRRTHNNYGGGSGEAGGR